MRLLVLDNRQDLESELTRVGADRASWDIFCHKHQSLAVKVDDLSLAGANILKQTALSIGADCAVNFGVVSGKARRTAAVLFVTRRQLEMLPARLREQPKCVARLGPGLEALSSRLFASDHVARFGRNRVDLSARSHVMGILNVTPDSFYDGGRHFEPEAAAARAVEMQEQGADFIDIGAESTRPGSEPVSAKEQLARILPVMKLVRRQVKVPISVDTTSARVAEQVLDAGAKMVNDISGLAFDRRMAKVVARAGVPCAVMHIRGRPKTMQRRPEYQDLMADVIAGLEAALERGEKAGVRREQMIVDPGIGFGKTAGHNLEILRRLGELRTLGRPILVGPSRKSFLGKVLGLGPERRLEGSLAACVLAARHGAGILRVHDVEQAVRALRVADAVSGRPGEGG
ncbi:MAG: dihydropteroate synthase [candidate division WOR-3 bacterium]|nr:MAG: dihydropteroate synthase [candidate division WOR-3 bacterium]